MGTVLEMSAPRAAVAATLGLALLSGCGAGPGAGGLPSLPGVIEQVTRNLGEAGDDGDDSVAAGPAGDFSPEAIAEAPAAYRFVQINALGLAEPARVVQANGPEVTIAFQSGPTAAFDGGILAATRGLGDDLWALSAPGLLGALQAGGGNLTRVMETLDDQDRIVATTFACAVEAAGTETIDLAVRQATARRVEETCRGEAVIFENVYWLDASGSILASQQFVSPSVAYLRSNGL